MSYGTFNTPRRICTSQTKNMNTGVITLMSSGSEISKNEVRSGSNHSPNSSGLASLQERYSFSKDGKTVRVYIGTEDRPVRRFRWVGPPGSQYRQYYIVNITKHIYVDVPRPQYTYRNSNKSGLVLGMLRPNPLSYSLEDRSYPQAHIFRGFDTVRKVPYEVTSDGRLLGNMVSGRGDSSVGTRDPFSLIDFNPTTSQWNDLSNSSLFGLYEKVASRFPDVGTMIGESKETLGMIRTLLNEGVDLVVDLIKKDKRRLAGRLKAPADFASNVWLTYVYGVKPAVQDYNSLLRLPSQNGIRTYVTSSKKEQGFQPYELPNGLTALTANFRYKVEVRHGVIMSADLSGAQKAVAMNLFNVAGVGYNLIPFSFMYDWFHNVGGYLNSQSALQFGFLYGWKTTYFTKEWIGYQATGISNPNYQFGSPGAYLSFTRKVVNVVRTPLIKSEFPAMPNPKLDFTSFNEIKGLNALAILIQRHNAFDKL